MFCDVIGDIHGHCDELVALLRHLGYRETGGAWRHPDGRLALFVGDLIDRGPKQLETVMLVRRMAEAGSAMAIMGNHELNAVAWLTPDPHRPGEFLRKHVHKNRHQHAAFLAAVEGKGDLHRELADWFLTLPLWLDVAGLRVAHACGHARFVGFLKERLPDGRLTREHLVEALTPPEDDAERDTPALTLFKAVEAVAKGLEVPLPDGRAYVDKDGHRRDRARVRWWDEEAVTYRRAALLQNAEHARPDELPDELMPEHLRPLPLGNVPHFFGHYWLRGTPAPVAPRAACLDYSVAKNGKLVAYRWDGDPELKAASFAWVSV